MTKTGFLRRIIFMILVKLAIIKATAFGALLTVLMCTAVTSAHSQALVLNDIPLHHKYSHAKQSLSGAYEQLGINLEIATLPYTRGITSANRGDIDGLLLRVEKHTQSYDNLIKINVELLASKTLLVIDQTMCGQCELDDLHSVAAVSGFSFPRERLGLDKPTNYLIEISDHKKLWRFFKAHRVNAIVTSELFLPEALRDTQRYRHVEIAQEPVYHYLHKHHKGVAAQLEILLQDMMDTGQMAQPSQVQPPLSHETEQVQSYQSTINADNDEPSTSAKLKHSDE